MSSSQPHQSWCQNKGGPPRGLEIRKPPVKRGWVAPPAEQLRRRDDVGKFGIIGEMDQRAVRLHRLARRRALPEQSRMRLEQQRIHEIAVEHARSADETLILELNGEGGTAQLGRHGP